MEVAHISRSIARSLRLNEDLSELLGLAHDIGHTPFAHAGQKCLDALMKPYGGFEHNCQLLRQVTRLERRYLGFPGLNLSFATLLAMVKHVRVYPCDTEMKQLYEDKKDRSDILEAVVVNLADRITYLHHDLEDGIDSGLLRMEDLSLFDAWKEAWERHRSRPGFADAPFALQVRSVLRYLFTSTIEDFICFFLRATWLSCGTYAKKWN